MASTDPRTRLVQVGGQFGEVAEGRCPEHPVQMRAVDRGAGQGPRRRHAAAEPVWRRRGVTGRVTGDKASGPRRSPRSRARRQCDDRGSRVAEREPRRVGAWHDQDMDLLNVVFFGDRDDYIRGHVLSAQDRATGSGFHLDKWAARPEPGMLDRPALITYVPTHGAGWRTTGRGSSGSGRQWRRSASSASSGAARSCSMRAVQPPTTGFTTTDGFVASAGRWPTSRFSADRGIAKSQQSHGKGILGELVDVLSGVRDAHMSGHDLLTLLTEVWGSRRHQGQEDSAQQYPAHPHTGLAW